MRMKGRPVLTTAEGFALHLLARWVGCNIVTLKRRVKKLNLKLVWLKPKYGRTKLGLRPGDTIALLDQFRKEAWHVR